MPRPKKERIVRQPPLFTRFKPAGIRGIALSQLSMSLDEYEAIRLADYRGMDHAEAAVEMEISRSTFTRLIERARKKSAQLLTDGRILCIEGGNIHFRGNVIRCLDCGQMFNTGFQSYTHKCTACGSTNLKDLAGSFGHGLCCRGRSQK